MARPSDAKLEAEFQAAFIKRLRSHFGNEIIVMKQDSGYQQGIPDLAFWLFRLTGMIEVKPYEGAEYEPNQEYFLEVVDGMGHFSATLYPENEEVVFRAIVRAASRAR